MHHLRVSNCLAVGLFLVSSFLVTGASPLEPESPPAEAKSGRTDLYGDALPPGAIARLGTVRFRHGGPVHAVAFSPDGKILASAAGDSTIRLWEMPTGKELRRLDVALPEPQQQGFGYSPFAVAFSPDGKTLAGASGSNKLFLWEVATGKQLHQFDSADGAPPILTFSPDGKILAWIDSQMAIHLVDAASGKALRQLQGYQAPVRCLAFSPDGKLLAVGESGAIRLWDASTGASLRKLRRHQGTVTSVAFSPDGKTLASAGDEDNTIRLWDPTTGRQLRQLNHQHTTLLDTAANSVHEYGIATSQVVFSADGKTVASIGKYDRMARLWETATGKELAQFQGPAPGFTSIALSGDGRTLAAGAEDNTVRAWDVATAKPVGGGIGHWSRVFSVKAGGNGKTAISASRDNTIRIWDLASAKELHRFGENEDRFFQIAMSRDGRLLATGRADDEAIVLRDLDTGKELGQLSRQQTGVSSLALSGDGRLLASMALDGTICLWDTAGTKLLREIGQQQQNNSGMTSLAFSHDAKLLASVSEQNTICLWEVASGKQLHKFSTQGQQEGTYRIVFSPDGRTLFSTGQDNSVCLWAADTGKLLHKFEQQSVVSREGMIIWEALALSADGRLLATIGPDNSIQTWEVATRKELRKFQGHQGSVASLAFTPDGRTLLTGSLDTTVLAWDLTGLSPDGRPPAKELSAKDLDNLWNDLSDADALKANRAFWSLVAGNRQTVFYLQERLKASSAIDPRRLAKLLADLDSEQFTVREKATQELEQMGEMARPAMQKTLESKPSPEVTRRIEQILERMSGQPTSRDWLRVNRALAVLEAIGSAEARVVLEGLAKGAADAPLTRDAQAALDRLAGRMTPAQ